MKGAMLVMERYVPAVRRPDDTVCLFICVGRAARVYRK